MICGVATGGIAHGMMIADALNLPFCYVRAEAKVHGLTNLIEGVVGAGQKVVIIEDLISTGKSSLKAVTSLRNAGCTVQGMISILDEIGYNVVPIQVLKAIHFNVPQKRERLILNS